MLGRKLASEGFQSTTDMSRLGLSFILVVVHNDHRVLYEGQTQLNSALGSPNGDACACDGDRTIAESWGKNYSREESYSDPIHPMLTPGGHH